jgi:hypothetical protein
MKNLFAAINKWLVATPTGRIVRTFLLTALGLALADWIENGQINFSHWTTWVIVPAGPLLGVAYDALSKNFPLFGVVAADVAVSPKINPVVQEVVAEAAANSTQAKK